MLYVGSIANGVETSAGAAQALDDILCSPLPSRVERFQRRGKFSTLSNLFQEEGGERGEERVSTRLVNNCFPFKELISGFALKTKLGFQTKLGPKTRGEERVKESNDLL